MNTIKELAQNEITLLTELCESRLVKNDRATSAFTSQDMTDLIYLYVIALKIMRKHFEFAPKATAYVRATIMYGNFTQYHTQATDLYMMLRSVLQSDTKFKKPEASSLHLDDVNVRSQDFLKWARSFITNQDDETDRRFLIKLEQSLSIHTSAYKSIRRLVCDWDDLDREQRCLAMTRLLMAFRARAKKSEILPYLERIAKDEKLEIKTDVYNPETGKHTGSKGSGLLRAAAIAGSAYLGYKAGHAITGSKKE